MVANRESSLSREEECEGGPAGSSDRHTLRVKRVTEAEKRERSAYRTTNRKLREKYCLYNNGKIIYDASGTATDENDLGSNSRIPFARSLIGSENKNRVFGPIQRSEQEEENGSNVKE